MKSIVGFVGVREHAERSAEHAVLAGISTPVPSLAGLGAYYMAFVGDTERAIAQTQLAVAAAKADGDLYWATWAQRDRLFYTALLAPGTDETLRLADELRRDVERTGSVLLRHDWLIGMAITLRSLDPDRALALLDESIALAPRENVREAVQSEFFRGLVLFARGRYADAATALRRALVGSHDMGNRLSMLNVLSAVTGVAERTDRSEAAAVLLAGLRAARREYQVPGSANERHAETRIEEHLQRRLSDPNAAQQIRRLDIEATIDLALDTLDDIAADAPA
jgi:tetratricopeptide (TPR) repeat protein